MEIVFQILDLFFGYLGSYATKKRNILIFLVMSTIFSILTFWSIENYAAILPALVTGIRYFVFMFKEKYKSKLPLYLCLIMHFAALLLSVKAPIDSIPSILSIIGCLAFWYLDEEKLKLGMFAINIPWILYYIYFGLYITALNVTVKTILIVISFVKICKKKRILKFV